MKASFPTLLSLVIAALCTVLNTVAATSDPLVVNGSFENGTNGWTGNLFATEMNTGAGSGTNHARLAMTFPSQPSYAFQDIVTEPGKQYVLVWATRSGTVSPVIEWNAAPVPNSSNFARSGHLWRYHFSHVIATATLTRLQIHGPPESGPASALTMVDDIKLYPIDQPVVEILPPVSQTALEGKAASFSVTADGPPLLSYQWLFNEAPITDATNRSLTIDSAGAAHVGEYRAVISNAWTSCTSTVARLLVEPVPKVPQIVSQVAGGTFPVGYRWTLGVYAIGEAPLSFQWYSNGSPVIGATNTMLVFPALQLSDAGTFHATVSNQNGVVQSLSAELTVTNTSGGGRIAINTYTNNAYVYHIDGFTPAPAGTMFHVYAGPTAESLKPIGDPISMNSGHVGLGGPPVIRQLPDVPAGAVAFVQYRAWEGGAGTSYEQARASGGMHGRSAIYPTTTSPASTSASQVNRVLSTRFSLQRGESYFVVGRIAPGANLGGGRREFTLAGSQGGRYLVEVRQPPQTWVPFVLITNVTGLATFEDSSTTAHPVQFYRARLLD